MMTRPLLQTYTPFPFPFVQGERDRVLDTAGRYYFDFYGAIVSAALVTRTPTW